MKDKTEGKKTGYVQNKTNASEASEADADIRQEVEKITEAYSEIVEETSLADKVEELRTNIDNISEDVESWRTSRAEIYMEALETLKSQVDEIHNEWNTVSSSMKSQHERLESVLESFPGIIETSTLRALSLRMTHLESLVTKLIEESNVNTSASRSRKQLTISLVALGVTVILWVIWMILSYID
jgi:seryl-tRNA synthetase